MNGGMTLAFDRVRVELGGQTVVHDGTLVVPAHHTTALVGPNGCGKSSLLRTAYRALRPRQGAVWLGNDDAWSLPARSAAQRRAVVTQHQSPTTDFTVADMVAMARNPYHGPFARESDLDREIIAQSLARVDLTWATDRLFTALSGGERQRVLIARALAQQAPVVILDEPTNHLDVLAQHDLLALVTGLGVTVLAALHDLNHATAYADQVAVMNHGRIVAVGGPAEVLTPALIAEVFGMQAHIGPHPITGRPHVALAPLPRTR